MIKARLNSDNGPLYILGIDAENVRRLKEGKPILTTLADVGGADDVMIIYGETLDDIKSDIERAMGRPFPKATTADDLKKQAS